MSFHLSHHPQEAILPSLAYTWPKLLFISFHFICGGVFESGIVISLTREEGEMTQWLESDALPMSLPAVQCQTQFSEKYFSTQNIGTLFQYCVLAQGTLPSSTLANILMEYF